MLLKFLVNKTTFLKAYLKKTEQEKLAPKIVRQKLDFSGNPKLWERTEQLWKWYAKKEIYKETKEVLP